MRVKIVIRRQHARVDQLLLEDIDEVEQVLRIAVADVVSPR